MRSTAIVVCSFLMLSGAVLLVSQEPPPGPLPLPRQTISLPTFTSTATVAGTNYTYTLLGGDPAKGGTTTIPTVLVAITLTIDAPMAEKPCSMPGRLHDRNPRRHYVGLTSDVAARLEWHNAGQNEPHRSPSSVACDRLD